jgi:hypothetical protein
MVDEFQNTNYRTAENCEGARRQIHWRDWCAKIHLYAASSLRAFIAGPDGELDWFEGFATKEDVLETPAGENYETGLVQ